jgi:hypothetical protein
MRRPFIALCLLVTVALLVYYATRRLSVSTPLPVPQIVVVSRPELNANTEPASAGPEQNPVDAGTATGSQAASDEEWRLPTQTKNCETIDGLPDSRCTPGDIVPSETSDVLCSNSFHTGALRDKTTTRTQKNRVYAMYGIAHPPNNIGSGQVCEIDHLIALELGGADTMANLWPECSAGYGGWQGPGFRDKDGFENYLWYHLCVDQDISLGEAQRQIATNWRKFWEIAGKPECRNRAHCR